MIRIDVLMLAAPVMACVEPVPVPDVDDNAIDSCIAISVVHPPPRDVALFEGLDEQFTECRQTDTQIVCAAAATSMEQCRADVAPVAQAIVVEFRDDAQANCVRDCDE